MCSNAVLTCLCSYRNLVAYDQSMTMREISSDSEVEVIILSRYGKDQGDEKWLFQQLLR